MSRKHTTTSRTIVEQLEDRRLYAAGVMNFDLNRDGEINGDDFFVIDSNAGQEVSGWANGDINGDGHCDGSDLDLLTGAWETALGGKDSIQNDSGDFQSLILLPGDANSDGVVNDVDMYDTNFDGIVDDLERWESEQGPVNRTGTWNTGDFTGDGLVDDNDVVIFNAVKDGVIDGDEWFEIDSRQLQPFVSAFH